MNFADRLQASIAQLWDFIPYVPEGQFDVASAYRKDLTGVLAAYIQPYWNIAKP